MQAVHTRDLVMTRHVGINPAARCGCAPQKQELFYFVGYYFLSSIATGRLMAVGPLKRGDLSERRSDIGFYL